MAEWDYETQWRAHTCTVDLEKEGSVTVQEYDGGIMIDCSHQNHGKAHMTILQAQELLTVLSQAVYFAIDRES